MNFSIPAGHNENRVAQHIKDRKRNYGNYSRIYPLSFDSVPINSERRGIIRVRRDGNFMLEGVSLAYQMPAADIDNCQFRIRDHAKHEVITGQNANGSTLNDFDYCNMLTPGRFSLATQFPPLGKIFSLEYLFEYQSLIEITVRTGAGTGPVNFRFSLIGYTLGGK